MEKIKWNSNLKVLVVLIIALLLAIISLVAFLRESRNAEEEPETTTSMFSNTNTGNQTQQSKNEKSSPKTDEEIVKYLATLGERDRMQYYCTQYFKYIQNSNYSKAYEFLYEEFKQNYFPAFEDFEEYVKNYYPSFYGIEFDDITRQGNLYVLRVKIVKLDGENGETEEVQRFVIRENYYNDFVMSFQVK